MAYNLLHQTGICNEAQKEWRNKDSTNKTWPNVKEPFVKVYKECLENITARNMGYGGVNMVQEELHDSKKAIEHLANAAIHDKIAARNSAQANNTLTQHSFFYATKLYSNKWRRQ
eukprot:14087213-Ditylum_brightwellii.AAC.1